MSRQNRIQSPLGIYHVMLRGINKQNIFFCEDDFVRMMAIFQEAPYEKDLLTDKVIADDLCTIYAYCILDNHLHLLIREGRQNISEIMKRIEDRYALYYNKKYERTGHLFQARFPSEPVNDSEYFYTLLRYIHRNPVKAQECNPPEAYPYSSWNEYIMYNSQSGISNQNGGTPNGCSSTKYAEPGSTLPSSNIMKVLKPSAIRAVLKKYPFDDLSEWVNISSPNAQHSSDDLAKANQCLDMNSFTNVITDQNAMEILLDLSGLTNPEDFRLLDAPTQIYHLLQAIDHGVNIRQASRLGTITYYQLQKAHSRKNSQNCGETPTTGSVPAVDKTVEKAKKVVALANAFQRLGYDVGPTNEEQYIHLQELQQKVRQIEGLSKKTYQKLHLIVEYLYKNPSSKCQEIATHLDISNESARRFLIRLANENIVQITGKSKQSAYSLL